MAPLTFILFPEINCINERKLKCCYLKSTLMLLFYKALYLLLCIPGNSMFYILVIWTLPENFIHFLFEYFFFSLSVASLSFFSTIFGISHSLLHMPIIFLFISLDSTVGNLLRPIPFYITSLLISFNTSFSTFIHFFKFKY